MTDSRSFKRLLDIHQTAEYLNISAKSIYNQCGPRAKRPFPVKPKKIGRLIRFDIKDLDEYINKL